MQNAAAVLGIQSELKTIGDALVVVNGHASTEGGEKRNLGLSERRRDEVLVRLQTWRKGIEFQGKGFGEWKPLAEEIGSATQIEAARQQNRRVDITVIRTPKLKLYPAVKPLTDTELMKYIVGLNVPKRPKLSMQEMFKRSVLEKTYDKLLAPIVRELPIPDAWKADIREAAIDGAADGLYKGIKEMLLGFGMDPKDADIAVKIMEAAGKTPPP